MIHTARRGGIAITTLAHHKANALDIELCDALVRTFNSLEGSDAAAVVVTGQGAIFSAGVDLVRAAHGGTDYLRTFLPVLSRAFETVFFFPKPVVAALNGHAVAGGCVLACAADRRLMARGNGRIGVTELRVGVPFPTVAFEIMRAVTAPHRLAEVMLGAQTYEPDAARELGLIDEIVDGDVLERSITVAESLAALSPDAFRITKQQMRHEARERIERDGARIDAEIDQVWLQPGTLARMRDYVAKTLKK
jgi:enoyl-CoA hydratase/carnithine racemase